MVVIRPAKGFQIVELEKLDEVIASGEIVAARLVQIDEGGTEEDEGTTVACVVTKSEGMKS